METQKIQVPRPTLSTGRVSYKVITLMSKYPQQLSAMKAAIEEAQQAGGAESLLPPQQELSDDPIEQEGEQHDEAIAIEKRILWCSCFATAEGEWTLFFGHF